MSLGILGTLCVQVDEATAVVTRPVVRNVLGALLLHPTETPSTARLAELAWGPDGCTAGTLHTTVSRLREWLNKQCGPAATVTRNGHGYRLELPQAENDFLTYQQLVQAPRPDGSRERADVLHQALGLWRGPIFADGPEWVRTDPLVRQWEDSRISLVLDLSDAALRAEKPELAVEHLENLASESPYDERIHAHLLTILRACGRRAEALLRYETIRRRLAEELGVGPGEALAEVHAELLREPRSTPRPPASKSRELVIGTLEAMVALPQMRALLGEMSSRYPDLNIKVRHFDFVGQMNALPQGEADVIVLYLPVPEGLEVEPLTTGHRAVAVSDTHPFVGRDRVSLADLADQPVVSISESVPQEWRDFWAVDPRPDGTPVRYTSDRASNLEALFSAAALGNDSLTIVPAACRELYPRPGINYIDVTDMEPITVALVWLPGHESPAVTALIREARRLRRSATEPTEPTDAGASTSTSPLP